MTGWLVTPEGHGFLSAGMNHVDYKEDYSPEFVRFVRSHLKDWGFNTVGWSQELAGRDPDTGAMVHSRGWGPQQYRGLAMPYTHLIRFTDVEWYVDEQFPDVFSDAFAEKCDRLAEEVCPALSDDPNLIGYFYSDTPNWPLWAEQAGPENLRRVADKYYQVIHDAIRRYDPNHLLFGPRFARPADTPDWVIQMAGEYFDVILCNGSVTAAQVAEDLGRCYQLSGKPMLISDMLYLAPTELLKVGRGAACYVPDQKARGEAYRRFAEAVLRNSYVVGLHWCAFLENRCRKSGLKNYGSSG